MTGQEEVLIYVSKAGDAGSRLISFRRPEQIDARQALAAGWALDGNRYLIHVPVEALATKEAELLALLEELGYAVRWA